MLVRILKYIWVFYAIIAFTVSLLLILPIYIIHFLFFRKERADKKAYIFTRLWAKFLAIVFFVRLRKKKDFRLRRNEQFIFIANHRSMLDIPFTAALIPNHFRFLAKSSLLKIPIMGIIVRGICITVDRNSIRDKSSSYSKMKETLASGSSVLLFPEGTRSSKSTILNPFQNGAFKLSTETNIPIVVITLWETTAILKKNAFWEMRPGKINCFISKPIKPFDNPDIQKDIAFNIMNANIESVAKR